MLQLMSTIIRPLAVHMVRVPPLIHRTTNAWHRYTYGVLGTHVTRCADLND